MQEQKTRNAYDPILCRGHIGVCAGGRVGGGGGGGVDAGGGRMKDGVW